MALIDLALPDEISVTDAITIELSQIPNETNLQLDADAVSVADSIATELSQIPGEIHVELEDTIAVGDVLEALHFDGAIHLVTDYTKRGRPGDTITILGSGFSQNNNSIRLDGSACSIVTESPTKIVVTQPTTFNVTDGFAVLAVNNFDNNRFTEVPFWIKDAIDDLETKDLPDQEPGPEEFAGSVAGGAGASVTGATLPDPTRAEARMWERMATMVDFLKRDTLVALGDMFVRDAIGLTLLDGSSEVTGQRLVADSGAAEGVRWGREVDADPPFGVRIPSGTTTAVLMRANGVNGSTATGDGDEWPAVLDGTIDAAYVYQQSSVPNTDRLTLVRILVDGSEEFTSGAISIAHRGKFVTRGLSIAVTAGQRIQLEVTKTGATETMDLLGAVRMQTT